MQKVKDFVYRNGMFTWQQPSPVDILNKYIGTDSFKKLFEKDKPHDKLVQIIKGQCLVLYPYADPRGIGQAVDYYFTY